MRTIVLSGLAAFLAWQVVAQSFAAYLAESMPQTALWLHPRQPTALVNLADRALNAAADGGGAGPAAAAQKSGPTAAASGSKHAADGLAGYSPNLNRAFSAFETVGRNQSVNRPIAPENAPLVRAWAQAALLNKPLNAWALRILGQLAEADNDDPAAAKFMHAAAHLSLHENVADYWLMQKGARAGDDKSAVYYADVLLRTTPELAPYVVPVLAGIAEKSGAKGLLQTVLAGNPPWRAQFFALLPNSATDVRTPLDLLLALRTSAMPPTATEFGGYIDFLVARKLYDLAYYTWLQFLPAQELRSAGLLFNGSFEVVPSGLPFDWQIAAGSGVTIDIVPRSDKSGGHALLVDFEYGRVDYHGVAELVMLSPGRYEFAGKYKGELVGPRGLKWRIACAGAAATRIGESPVITGMMPEWQTVAFAFTVPATDCRAQYVRLELDARMASEELVSGSMLFDELRISRSALPPS